MGYLYVHPFVKSAGECVFDGDDCEECCEEFFDDDNEDDICEAICELISANIDDEDDEGKSAQDDIVVRLILLDVVLCPNLLFSLFAFCITVSSG